MARIGFSAKVPDTSYNRKGARMPILCRGRMVLSIRLSNFCGVHSDVLTRHKGCQAIVILIDVKTFVLFSVPLVQASRH